MGGSSPAMTMWGESVVPRNDDGENFLQPRALCDHVGEGSVDDGGCIELLLDQAGAEIEVDGLLLAGDDGVVDGCDPDLCAGQPVHRDGGGDVHQPAPAFRIILHM